MGRVWKQIFHILWNIFIFYEFSCSRINLFCLDHGTLKKRPTVAQQGGKTGGQSPCRVKQKSHICSSWEEVFVKFMETCYRVTLQYLQGTTNYKVQPSWEEKRAAENKFEDLLTDRFFYFCKLDGGKKTKYKNSIKSYGCGVSVVEFEKVNASLFQPIYSIYFHAKNFL